MAYLPKGIELAITIGASIYAFGSIVLGGHATGLYDEPYTYIVFVFVWIQVLWNIWCFVVVLRCYEYVKNMKMAQTNKTEMV
uniref:Uncharacterized protein n=1 Tax=Panagrolaimus davidi TaxID=227884 RepID=A0A914RDK7_9BILA